MTGVFPWSAACGGGGGAKKNAPPQLFFPSKSAALTEFAAHLRRKMPQDAAKAPQFAAAAAAQNFCAATMGFPLKVDH